MAQTSGSSKNCKIKIIHGSLPFLKNIPNAYQTILCLGTPLRLGTNYSIHSLGCQTSSVTEEQSAIIKNKLKEYDILNRKGDLKVETLMYQGLKTGTVQ